MHGRAARQGRRGSPTARKLRTADYLASLFPGASVLPPPVSPEWRHCCILYRRSKEPSGLAERDVKRRLARRHPMSLRFHWMLPKAANVAVEARPRRLGKPPAIGRSRVDPQLSRRLRVRITKGWLHFAGRRARRGRDRVGLDLVQPLRARPAFTRELRAARRATKTLKFIVAYPLRFDAAGGVRPRQMGTLSALMRWPRDVACLMLSRSGSSAVEQRGSTATLSHG